MSRRLRPLGYADRRDQLARDGAPRGFGGRLPTLGRVTDLDLPDQAIGNRGDNPKYGQLLALTGTVTIPAGGGSIASMLDTIVDQVGFGKVTAAGDPIVLPYTATYLLEVAELVPTDGFRGDIAATWTSTPEGAYYPGETSLVDDETAVMPGNAGETLDLVLAADDGAAHTAEITVVVALVEPIPQVERTAWPTVELVGSGTNVRTGWTPGRPKNLAYPTVSGGIQAGDLLVITVSTRSDAVPVTPSGFTAIASVSPGGEYSAVYAKTAVGGESGSVSVTYTGFGTFAECSWQMAVFRGVGLPKVDSGGQAGVTAPSVTGEADGLLVTVHGGWAASGGYSAPASGMTLVQSSSGYQGVKNFTCMKTLDADGATGAQTPTHTLGGGSQSAVAATFPNVGAV